jgi:hypothetical protein
VLILATIALLIQGIGLRTLAMARDSQAMGSQTVAVDASK